MKSKVKFTGKELAKHLIVISIDALSEDNWDEAKKLPNFSKLINEGVYSTELKSVFPTHTYVVHTSMVTGVYSHKHGIVHNNLFQPFIPDNAQNWYWYQRDIKVPTIYDLARDQGMITAGLLWPVTGKSSIKYNLPEIAAIKNENQAFKVLRNGSLFYAIALELRFGKHRKGVQQPHLDDFTTFCAIDTIKRKKPNLLLMHLIDLDDAKHNYGTKSVEVTDALKRMDRRIGEVMEACRDAHTLEETAFLIVGDHGQFDINYVVHLNNLLKDSGLIYEENGKMIWRAYLQSTGGSAYLHIIDKDIEAESMAINTLEEAMKNSQYGIERIYDREVLDTLHAHKSIKYAVEAKIGYCFDDEIKEPTIENYLEKGIKYATHGYSPEMPNYKCIFIASGSNIKKNYSLGPINMVDLAPTMASILGLDFYPCDGDTLYEIFSTSI